MANDPMRILGIDAGSVAVSVVETDGDGVILREEYRFHNGHPRDALRTVIAEWSALEAGFSGRPNSRQDRILRSLPALA